MQIIKKWWVLAVVVVVLSLASCSDETPQKVTETPSETETEVTNTPEIFNIGDSVETSESIFTVNAVRTDSGSRYMKPDEGNIYYIVDVTIENKIDESISISSMMMFSLFDSEGYSYDEALGVETKGRVGGEISPGRKLRGEIAYEIPANATGLELQIDPSLFGNGQAIYKLDR